MKSDTSHSDIYVARFDEHQGRLLETPRRLTIDERGSFPGAWTPDGETILFNLGQSGSQDIFTQSLSAESAEPLVVGPGNQVLPRMSSDGRWVLFQATTPTPCDIDRGGGSCVCRSPVAGRNRCSPPTDLPFRDVRFAAGVCCSSKTRIAGSFHHFDPVRGKGERLVFDTVQREGRGRFTRRKRRGSPCRRLSSDEPHSDLFAAWRAAEGCRGGERRRSQ